MMPCGNIFSGVVNFAVPEAYVPEAPVCSQLGE
jgi:hypothetical protein